MKKLYTSIPVGLCQYCIYNRKVNHLKVYLYLKFTSSGHVKYTNSHLDVAKEIAKYLHLNEKTIKSCLNWLIQNGWITTYSNIKSLRIVSYSRLAQVYNIKTTCAVIYENETFEDLRNFCCAVLVIYYRNYKRWCDKKSVSKKGDARLRTNKKSKGYYPLPCSYLAKCLNVSKKTAHKYKRAAMEYGHIEVRKNLKTLSIKGVQLTNEHKGSLKFIIGINLGRVRTGKKYLKYVDADLIKSNLYMKKKRY